MTLYKIIKFIILTNINVCFKKLSLCAERRMHYRIRHG